MPGPRRWPRRAAVVAGLDLRRAGPVVAILVREPRQEPVELVALKVELGQLGDDAELGVEVVGPVEGPPVDLNGFLGLVLAGQGLGQGEDDLGVVGIGPHSPAQGVEPFFRSTELKAKLGEILIVVGITRCGRQQVAARLQGGVDPAQPGFQLGNAGQVFGAIAAVDLAQPPQGVGRVAQAAGRLADPSGQCPGRDRARGDRDRPVGGSDRLGELAVGLEVTRQHGPAFRIRVLVADPVPFAARRFARPAARLPGRS